jgi:hypothetical protein
MISVIGVNLLLPIWAVVFSRRILPLFAFTEKRVHYLNGYTKKTLNSDPATPTALGAMEAGR